MTKDFIPFPHGSPEFDRFNEPPLTIEETHILKLARILVWPARRNRQPIVEICSFLEAYATHHVKLIDILRQSFTGDYMGEAAEIEALTKLKTDIDEIIAKLRRP